MAVQEAENPGYCGDMPDNGSMFLLHDLTLWREQVARSIARNNPELHSDQIASAVNRILFPFLLLRIAEDRHLVPAGTVVLLRNFRTVFHLLSDLGPYADALYADRTPASGPATDYRNLIVEERVLHGILNSLVNPDRRYDCRKMDLLVLGDILMRYLARTIRRSAAYQATIVDTHDTVVSGRTIISPHSLIRYVTRNGCTSARNNRSVREVLPLRVLDPACGSGTVLLATYIGLLEHVGGASLTFEERYEILINSVYGIDVNRHAVAASRMLLFFALCQSREFPSDQDFLCMFQSVTRDLRHTILCGNALVGPEIVDDESWMFCPIRDRHSLNIFSYRDEFPEIVESGGFDAVVCEPPEGLLEQREWIQQYFQRRYASYHPAIDRSAFFFEKSLSLVRPGGVVSFIMSGRWLRGASGSPFREMLAGRQIEEIVDLTGIPAGDPGGGLTLLRVRTLPPAGPFYVVNSGAAFPGDPDTFPANRFPVDPRLLNAGGWVLRDSRVKEILRKVSLHSTPLEAFVMGEIHEGVLVRTGDPFVIEEAMAKEWLKRDPRCRNLIRPLISGTEIGSSHLTSSRKFLINVPRGWTVSHPNAEENPWLWFKRRHPLIARHLRPFEAMLKARAGPDALWWETSCEEFWQIPKKKILFPACFGRPVFLFDSGRVIGDDTTGAIPSAGAYLAGILNSRLLLFVFTQSTNKNVPDRHLFSWEDIRSLPIYTPDFDRPEDLERHGRIEMYLRRLSGLEKTLLTATAGPERDRVREKIRRTSMKIDAVVYDLYGLTADEIAIAESRSPL